MFLLLQLADGSFPSGGFAHSAGLEASMLIGGLDVIEDFLDDAIVSARETTLPFVRAAGREPARLAELDDRFDATLPLDVPNRASRAQGRSFASAAARVFDLETIALHARRGPAHHAPIFGAVFGSLGMSVDDTATAYLHGAMRGVLSAAVRLNLVGPLEAQRILASRAPAMNDALCSTRAIDDVAQTAPLVELFGALHDQLDARLFQS
jgi:urease accessory protein